MTSETLLGASPLEATIARRDGVAIDRRQYLADVAALSARLPALSDNDAVVGLRGIAASIGDGHTFLAAPNRSKFPVELYWFGEDLAVVRAGAAYRHLLGTRLVSIGDHPVADVYNRLQQQRWQFHLQRFTFAFDLCLEPVTESYFFYIKIKLQVFQFFFQ